VGVSSESQSDPALFRPMKIAASGFVSGQAGSVASANALLINALLDKGHEIDFFSKPSFVDPRPSVGARPRFRFVSSDNIIADRVRAQAERVPVIGFLAGRLDCATYVRLLLRNIRGEHKTRCYDLCLWLGEYVPGRVEGLPTVSFAQGPPGTDARSIVSRFGEIRSLAGIRRALTWLVLAKLRLSKLGLPPLAASDHIIVGSKQSKNVLTDVYEVQPSRVSTLPYPIDLEMFRRDARRRSSIGPLKVLWVGRIVPRKRLDVFLKGLELAIRDGIDVTATIVGSVGFIPGYEKLIDSFPFHDRLSWISSVPREQVPSLMNSHDVLVQPSDEENFGSSVAEAQACGLPVIVGKTNGNQDYLTIRDFVLDDDDSRTLACALKETSSAVSNGSSNDWRKSRDLAVNRFSLEAVVEELETTLQRAAEGWSGRR